MARETIDRLSSQCHCGVLVHVRTKVNYGKGPTKNAINLI